MKLAQRSTAYQRPTLFGVVYTSRLFSEIESQNTLAVFRGKIGPTLDLQNPEHALALLEWLNKWGCRITKESFQPMVPILADWFQKWAGRFPRAGLPNLEAADLDILAGAYGDLLAIEEFGPTSAAKALFAVCSEAAMPWDAAIQAAFNLSGREPAKYRKMLEKSGHEAATLLAESAQRGMSDGKSLLEKINSRARTLPELLDQYNWVTITRRHQIPSCEDLRQWVGWGCCQMSTP
jgi:hypothetical protein